MDELNQAVPEVEIRILGRSFLIKCSFGVLVRLEKMSGLNPFDERLWTKPTPQLIAQLLYVAIKPQMPELEYDDLVEQISLEDAMQAQKVIETMMQNGTRSVKKKGEAQAPATPNQ